MRALGHSPNPASFLEDPPGPAPAEVNSDLAFWGDYAFKRKLHTATAVPDPDNGRLIVYNQTSGGPCYFVDVVEVPLDAPQEASCCASSRSRPSMRATTRE